MALPGSLNDLAIASYYPVSTFKPLPVRDWLLTVYSRHCEGTFRQPFTFLIAIIHLLRVCRSASRH